MILDYINDILYALDIDFASIFVCVVWIAIVGSIVFGVENMKKKRPQKGPHPTTINKSSSPQKSAVNRPKGPVVASDGHRIPPSKDITCEGQYGHDHGNTTPRFIVHEEPTLGYCNLNGKIVALKDCWKY